MYAVVEIAGQQYELKQNDVLTVSRLQGEPGDTVEFSNILAVHGEGDTKIGAPYVDGSVNATIVEHGRGEKVIVFHKKRRKGYRKLNGHRQHFTKIEVTGINA
ncbi:MAG: 50S ribosomal protein L21 [Bacteroidota bacterium]